MRANVISARSDAGPARPSGKQRVSAALRETRQKLANEDPLKPKPEYELLTMFVRNELGAAVTMPALSIIFSLASMFWAPVNEAIVWLLLVISSKVVLLELCRRFLAAPHADIDVKIWKRRFIYCELLNG